MNDKAHQREELGPSQAQHIEGDPNQAWKEPAFRLAVARRFYALGQDTSQIAQEMKSKNSPATTFSTKKRRGP